MRGVATFHKQLAKNNLPGFRARRNKRVSGSKFTFDIAEHAYHVQDLRTGWATLATASSGPGRAEGRGRGDAGGHGGATGGGGRAGGADGADSADGASSSGGLHFACFEIGILFRQQLLCSLTTRAGASFGTSRTRASPWWRGGWRRCGERGRHVELATGHKHHTRAATSARASDRSFKPIFSFKHTINAGAQAPLSAALTTLFFFLSTFRVER
jgi:hypothetical protein